MEFSILELESQLLGYPVIKINNFSSLSRDKLSLKRMLVNYDKCYLYVELPATELGIIHELEVYGFRFSEFRIYLSRDLTTYENYSHSFYPYFAELIADAEWRQEAIQLLGKQDFDDRFASDPSIPEKFSKRRNIMNLEKSFANYPKEQVIGLFNSTNSTLEGFWSLSINDNFQAHLYQYAVNLSRRNHLLPILDTLVLSYLKEQNIQMVKVISTGFNISEIHRLMANSGFEVTKSTVILRYCNI